MGSTAEEAVHCLVVRPADADPVAARLVADAHALGVPGVERIDRADLFFVGGPLSEKDRERLVAELLADPLLHRVEWRDDGAAPAPPPDTWVVETALHPGVTDPVAAAVTRGAALLGIDGVRAATGARFEIHGKLSADDLDHLVHRLLTNPVIETHTFGEITAAFPQDAGAGHAVEAVAVRDLDEAALVELSQSRGLALDPVEMRAVQAWFREEGREPTDVELETIAQTWSEHCNHKTFRAEITLDDGTSVRPLLHQLRAATDAVAAPWVRSAFVDNAGIVAFDDGFDLAIKAETHNHPSAVEPFGGANTGVGGVVRDVLGVSARPIAVTDVLCFGPTDIDPDALPEGTLHPRRVRSGVIAGVADYGNKLGVPTVSGAIVHHEGYTANPLVFCGCVGLLPRGSHRRSPRPGDRVVVIGGRTGRDGIRGATFSSMTMDATTGSVAGASVQIGDPVTEKGLIDVVLAARDAGLYTAITDCGAGGLSSAVGEMAAELGADVELAHVPRKYPGLDPWEVWLSEAQERMVLAVPDPAPLAEICALHQVELSDLGAFTGDGRLVVRHNGQVVLDLDGAFLHDGCPRRHLHAVRPVPTPPTGGAAPSDAAGEAPARAIDDPAAVLLALLAHPDIASKADVVRGYDHEVLGGTIVRPATGAADDGPADAAVLRPLGTAGPTAVAIACGLNPLHGLHDPQRMAAVAVDEAVRNVVAAGADPDRIALLDNFSWGDPRRPETLGALVAAVDGCCGAAVAHRAPFVSGKDSLNNEYLTPDGTRRAVPPTLVITAMGIVPDVTRTVTSDAKAPGGVLVLAGRTLPELRGSHLDAVLGVEGGGDVPAFDDAAPDRYRRYHALVREGLVRSCHDLSEGGLGVAAAEMAMGGRLGVHLTLPTTGPLGDPVVALFSESAGRLLLEVAAHDLDRVLDGLGRDDAVVLGSVVAEPVLRIDDTEGRSLVELPIPWLLEAWAGHVPGTARETPIPLPAGRVEPRPAATRPLGSPALVRARPPALVLSAPGTNRDLEAAHALELAGADPRVLPLAALRHDTAPLRQAGLLMIAGGFSYADALGAGVVLGLELTRFLGDELAAFVAAGRPVLGVCNGFQALVRCGLLPGGGRRASLAPNANGRFECRWVTLDAPASRSVWTAGLDEPIACPVAHGEGRFRADAATLADLRAGGQVALRYLGPGGHPAERSYPSNPNGSDDDIAGICDDTGLVLGLMPHPEDHVRVEQHPRRARGGSGGLGLGLFANGVRHARTS